MICLIFWLLDPEFTKLISSRRINPISISMMKFFSLSALALLFSLNQLIAQDDHAFFIKSIYDHTLEKAQCDQWLQVLSDSIGGRLTGSENASDAIDYTHSVLEAMSIVSRTEKQACTVPRWVRGPKEVVSIRWGDYAKGTDKAHQLNALSLGNTIGTGDNGVVGDVVEVFGLDTLETLGAEHLKNKVVFFNRPMDPKKIRTSHAYGEAVDQRVHGAARAGKYGAAAVLVRSVTTMHDDLPHTGVQSYAPSVEPIPSLAISTNDANMLSKLLKDNSVDAYIKNDPQVLDSVQSYNVIAEIKGSTHPDEIILVGGHLDSWDVGGGAHDDGSGCVHAMQVIETLQALGYKPKRTIRCVLFMNEENGLGGGKAYAKASNNSDEYHLAAIESDAGGFSPRGFGCSAHPSVFKPYLAQLQKLEEFLEPYDLYIKAGGGGADINPLKSQKGILIGLRPDGSRYFDFHHTTADVFENVNVRELRLGAAAMTSLVYLIDQIGLN